MNRSASGSGPAPAEPAAADLGCCNLRWSQALLEGMSAAGLRRLVLSPGARSTPLVIAAQRLEQVGRLILTPVLDERSAAFFALGLARASLQPVALLATSGSAPAHWYPAVIEAAQTGLPLLLLSADRPPRLHGWGANQTIDQTRLFGAFVREFHDPGPPPCPLPLTAAALKAQRALGRRAAAVSQGRQPGPVHLNLPFDEPLVPGDDCATVGMMPLPEAARATLDPDPDPDLDPIGGADSGPTLNPEPEQAEPHRSHLAGFEGAAGQRPRQPASEEARVIAGTAGNGAAAPSGCAARVTLSGWPRGRGLILCGPGAAPQTPVSAGAGEACAGATLAASLWRCAAALALPVLVDPLSGLRTGPGAPARVSAYDALLRNPEAARSLRPDWVLRIGQAPVSKVLGEWLAGVPAILVDPAGRWADPGHDALGRLELPAAAVCEALLAQGLITPDQDWLARWRRAEQRAWALVAAALDGDAPECGTGAPALTEGQVVRTLRRRIPAGEALLCANSMPIRQLDTWWRGGGAEVALLGNRGTSGIDGYLSTLAGLCAAGLPCWGLTGDLSFCHDLSGLLLAARLDRPLLVLNNGGGHIFDYLPQRELPEFARLWQTPQPVALGALAALAGLQHRQVADLAGLEQALAELGLGPGMIEVRIDPAHSRRAHLALWQRLARASGLVEDRRDEA